MVDLSAGGSSSDESWVRSKNIIVTRKGRKQIGSSKRGGMDSGMKNPQSTWVAGVATVLPREVIKHGRERIINKGQERTRARFDDRPAGIFLPETKRTHCNAEKGQDGGLGKELCQTEKSMH